jgi:hypothetical protein
MGEQTGGGGPRFRLFTATAKAPGRERINFVVMATTESEAKMWIGKWLGSRENTVYEKFGEGKDGLLRYENGILKGELKAKSTWVFDQNPEGKFFQASEG